MVQGLRIHLPVLALAAHRLKLERYRGDKHGPCARMTRKFVMRSIFLIDRQWEFAVWLRKPKQRLCINLEGRGGEGDGREVQKDGGMCIAMTDSG